MTLLTGAFLHTNLLIHSFNPYELTPWVMSPGTAAFKYHLHPNASQVYISKINPALNLNLCVQLLL